jgi:AraC-like DNA-binding protein
MDALSEALRAVRVTSAIFFSGEFSAPWRFAAPSQDKVAPVLSAGTEHLVLFHLVTEGRANARADGHDNVMLMPGDIVVFPHGDAHEVWNGRSAPLFPSTRLLPKLSQGEMAHEKWGGDGPVTRIICGYFGCERHAGSLFLRGLPAIFKINVRAGPAGSWIDQAIRHCVSEHEAHRPGRRAVLAKLAESLFMETLCRYMECLPPERTGWLAGARDSVVGQALAHLHRDPGRSWTLVDLAKASKTSRSVLAQRFMHLMGEAPLAYLGRLRLQLGARLLVTTDSKVLQVAYEVGYKSEAAFNRAFRHAFGTPPARYRRSHGASTPKRRSPNR